MKLYLLFIGLILSGFLNAQKQWTLDECVQYAMEHNIQVQQALLNESLAEVGLKQSKGRMLPSINGSASHTYNFGRNIDPITNSITTQTIQRNNFGVSSNVTLFNGFQRLNTLKQNEINVSAVQVQNEQLKNDISLNIANGFLNILFNREFLNIAEFNLEATQKQVEQSRVLFEAGQIPEGNLFEVLAQQANDEAALINAESNLNLAKLNLIQLMQLDGVDYKSFDISVPSLGEVSSFPLPSSIQAVKDNAIKNFPTMKVSEKNVQFNQMGVKIAKGARQPSLNLNYSLGTGYSDQNLIGTGELVSIQQAIGTVGTTGDVVISNPQQFYSDFDTKPFGDQFSDNLNHGLSFSLSIPIFNGWSTDGNIQRAQINLKNSELDMENTKNNLIQNVERAWADAEVAKKNYEGSDKTVEASQKAYDYAEVQFNAGVINQLDYNQARIRLDNAKIDLIRNKYDYIFKVKILDFYQGNKISF